jgi:hypothetical protein
MQRLRRRFLHFCVAMTIEEVMFQDSEVKNKAITKFSPHYLEDLDAYQRGSVR